MNTPQLKQTDTNRPFLLGGVAFIGIRHFDHPSYDATATIAAALMDDTSALMDDLVYLMDSAGEAITRIQGEEIPRLLNKITTPSMKLRTERPYMKYVVSNY